MSNLESTKATELYAGKSRVVALAGANRGIGQHVAEALLEAGFKVVLLLRKENLDLLQALLPFVPSDSPAGPAGLVAAPTDFSSRTALKGVFVTHDVDTVISALGLYGEDWRVEENLLWAAVDAGARRFAPSSWEAPVEWYEGVRAYAFKRKMFEVLKDAPISWTHFNGGLFMNYFGSGAPPKPIGAPQGHLNPLHNVLNITAGTALVPGSGNEPQAFTTAQDVARGAALACTLERAWTSTTGWMAGDVASYNEVVRIAEETTGRKLAVSHISLSEIEEKCVVPPSEVDSVDPVVLKKTFYWEIMRMFLQHGAIFEDGLRAALRHEGLEERWRPTSVKDFIDKWWGTRA